MSFSGVEHAWLLPLLLIAFLPIILHVLDRRRARVVDWPAMRLLVGKDAARLRRMRARELLLIAARSFAAFLIALAILQPQGRARRPVAAGAESPRAIALAIDRTLGMAYRETPRGPSSFERAVASALRVLDEAAPGSLVLLIDGSGQAAASPAEDPDAARARLRALDPRPSTFRILDALDDAARQLSALPLPGEVHIFTDLQASVLAGASPERARLVAERLRALAPPPLVRLVDCGPASASNRFVAGLESGPLAAVAGEPIELRAIVEKTGTGDEAPIDFALVGPLGEVARAAAGAEGEERMASIDLAHRFPAGTFPVAGRIPPDGLPGDDARWIVLEVPERIEILLTGTGMDDGGPGSARHADLALAPRSAGTRAPAVPFRTRYAAQPDEESLAEKRVLIVTGLLRLDDAEASLLERFVRDGGGLLVFAGEGIDLAALTEKLHRGGAGVLPCAMANRVSSEEGAHPTDVLVEHPALSIFADPEEGDLSRITVRRWTKCVGVAEGATVLARLSGGDPWIIEKATGRGKVIVVSTSASPDDSDLPVTPLFVPLLHRLARYLAGAPSGMAGSLCGETISLPVDSAPAGSTARAILPDGTARAAPIEVIDGRMQAVLRDTRAPGPYELMLEREGSRPEDPPLFSRIHAVNFPPEESRIERAGPEALRIVETALGLAPVKDDEPIERPLSMEDVEVSAWPAAVLLALLLLLLELALARRMARG